MTADGSWRDLVEQHGEAILLVAYRVLGNMHDAEDVAQQVLLEALAKERWPDFGILKRMAAFRSIDLLRGRKTFVPLDESIHVDSSPKLGSRIELEEQTDLLRVAISRLPRHQARCFWLRYVEGLSNREIADSQSMSESAVSTALCKAKLALRESVSREQQHSNE